MANLEYITSREAAEKWGISERRVQKLCQQGKILGASRLGWAWAIPRDAQKPIDARFKNKETVQMTHKYKLLDVFAGAGGFSLGFQLAGFNVIGAIEKDKWAAETFQFNHPDATVLVGDIENMSEEYIVNAIKQKPDIIIGGPPCQGYSICRKNAGDPKDPRNSLFTEFLRMARIFNPEILVMENVPNIVNAKTAKKEKVVEIIKKELELLGYFVEMKLLNAYDYGVPQNRTRFFIVGTKKKIKNVFPEKTHYIDEVVEGLKPCPTLWQAISDLPEIEAREGSEIMEYTKAAENDYQKLLRSGSDKVYNHVAMKHTKRVVERFANMTWGQSVSDIKIEHLKPMQRNGNGAISEKSYDQNSRRMHPNKICNTITAAFYSNFVHPYKNRNFTAREGARIQSFPDWYVFKGKPTVVSKKLLEREGRTGEAYLCQYSQIGNAVPPLLAKALADNLIKGYTI